MDEAGAASLRLMPEASPCQPQAAHIQSACLSTVGGGVIHMRGGKRTRRWRDVYGGPRVYGRPRVAAVKARQGLPRIRAAAAPVSSPIAPGRPAQRATPAQQATSTERQMADKAKRKAADEGSKKTASDRIEVRQSGVHGKGVYAIAQIAEGERVIEYKGEHISWKKALERHPHDP